MRIVFCSTASGLCIACNSSTCAERRLIEALKHKAAVAGVARHRVVRWVRQHAGILTVFRNTRDGNPACSLPCILCRQALDLFHLRWRALTRDGDEVCEKNAPNSVFTTRQKNTIQGGSSSTSKKK